LLAAVLYFVGRALAERLMAVEWASVHVEPWFAFLAAACLVAAGLGAAVLLRALLVPFCKPPTLARLIPTAWITPMGRYLPGKAASVVGAVWMLRKQGVPGAVAASVVAIRQGLSIATGLSIAVPLIVLGPVARRLPVAGALCLALLGLGVVALHPKVFGAATGFLLRKLGKQPLARIPQLREYARPLALMLMLWLLQGLSLWFTVRALTEVEMATSQIAVMVQAMALAATIGFLSFFAPAGLGVREGILLLTLSPSLGPKNAAIVTVAVRLVQTAVEVCLAAAGLICLWAQRQRQS